MTKTSPADSASIPRAFRWIGKRIANQTKLEIVSMGLGTIILVGLVDYLAGRDISLSFLYAVPISVVTWFAGRRIGLWLSLLSVILWLGGDYATGLQGTSIAVPFVNGMLRLSLFYLLITVQLQLQKTQNDLAALSAWRGEALKKETAARQRLEHELLDISDREQRRIGQDLHDGLCQHLTGTAINGLALMQRLAQRDAQEFDQAAKVVGQVEEAITLAKGMAKGLYPVEMRADGLMQALEEFAISTSDIFGVTCIVECASPVLVHAPGSATHLFRIAQEAVGNAIKHGPASHITILLEETEHATCMVISDNGKGFTAMEGPFKGMGVRIMNDRARMLGGDLRISRNSAGGTVVLCLVPREALLKDPVHV